MSLPTKKPRILIIDDEPFFLDLISTTLSDKYLVSVAKSGIKGLEIAQGSHTPDLILLDIVMPEMDGYTVCKKLKQHIKTHHIPIIFLTAKNEAADEIKGLQLGATDYITKPISIPILTTRVSTHLSLSQQKIALELLVEKRTIELETTKNAIIYSMGEMAESRDKETGNHLLRTSQYVFLLATELTQTAEYKESLSEQLIKNFARAAPLHDIGKIGIPDRVLKKESPLNPDERQIMDQHPLIGKQNIESAESKIGTTLFIQIAKDIAYSHHEKWDGTGYPEGLTGMDIPLAARLMALADVYDALISKRCYKPAFSHEKAYKIIVEKSGTHFDPAIVNAFINIHEQFNHVAQQYKDD